jgi:hypothetical protein
MPSKRDEERRKVMNRGRHFEKVDKNPRYYFEMHDHLNYRDFKKRGVEYVDQEGRQYIVATEVQVRAEHPVTTPTPGGRSLVKLYVRLPPGTEWYDARHSRVRIELHPVAANSSERIRVLTVRHRSILLPGHRSGHILVARSEWETS